MKNIKILFLYPPAGRQHKWEYSLGINYIQAYLKEKCIHSIQLIPEETDTLSVIINKILNENPDIVSFSCYDTNYYYVKLISQEIKKKRKEILILVGGPTATFSSNLILNDCYSIDIAIIGEGEIVTYEIIKQFYKKNWNSIKGIVFRKEHNLIYTEKREQIRNIDYYPSPYLSNIDVETSERIVVLTSRGCVYNCTYCNCTTMFNKKIRYHSISRVVDELEYIYINIAKENQMVLIGDDAFTLNIERAKKICKEILSRKIKLRLFCETRVDKIDDELLNLLKDAGFEKIDFGLESANPYVLRSIKKIFYQNEDVKFKSEIRFLKNLKCTVDKCKQIGISPMVNIIIGLPNETVKEAKETLKFVKKLDIRNYSHNILRIYSGTELFNTYKKYGYELNNSPFLLPYNIKYMFDVLSIKPLKNSISRNEIKKMKNSINLFLSGEIKELIFYNGKFSDLNSNILMEFKSNLILNKDIYIKVKSEKEVDDLIHNLVKENIPSNKINIVLDIDNEIQVYNYFEKHNIITIKKNDVINDGSISIVNIDTFKLVEDIINKRIPNPFLDSSKIILNKCKFCYGKCYITESKRGIINMKKNVLNICYSGEYINLMDEYEFRKFINEKKKKEYEERKCNLCEVNYRCPKCLYPAPLSVKEYCKVMKQFSFYFNDIDFIDEYCSKYKLPSSYKNILYKFRKNLNKDINKLTYQDFIKSIENKNITKEQLKIIIDFLKYFKR